MNIMLIPKDEVKIRGKYAHTVKELIEKVRKRRKYYARYNSERQKKKTDCRNNNLDPNSSHGIGYITEVLVAKKLGIKTCFDITGNFNYPGYDTFEHKDWGIINVKGSILRCNNKGLSHHHFNINKNAKPDFFFCVGYDKEMKHVTSIHIILNGDDVNTLNGITIRYGNDSIWDVFKESEEEIDKWDALFHTLKLENCHVLRKVK